MIKNLILKLLKRFNQNQNRARLRGETSKIRLSVQQSPKDSRDAIHGAYTPVLFKVSLPEYVSHKEKAPKPKFQGSLGSCGSHAICNAIETVYNKRKLTVDGLSELYHYYKVRQPKYMDTYPEDTGQYLRSGLKVAQKEGVCFEQYHPYRVSDLNTKPSFSADFAAKFIKIKEYKRCYDLESILREISNGFPVIIGIKVDLDFMYLRKEKYENWSGKSRGGHAVQIIGYNNNTQEVEILNSWGINWGYKGYCKIPYTVLREIMFEAWSIHG